MARLGISTGTTPNDGTGDTLLTGATKINSNFSEVYGIIGDGTNAFVGIVTQVVAGSNIGINTAYGSVTITGVAQTAEARSNTLVVTGVTTLGVVTGATSIQATKFYGDGSSLTGMASTTRIDTEQLVVSGLSTLTNRLKIQSLDSTPGRIDYYCETNNAHYTRVQAAPHARYSGNVTGTLPIKSGEFIVGDTDGAIDQNINTSGVVTATSFSGSGANLSNVVTSIVAGSNITLTGGPSGIVTIASSGGGGGGGGQGFFAQNATGIHTLSSVGIGTTNATGAADANNTTILNAGTVRANAFVGDGSGLSGLTGVAGTFGVGYASTTGDTPILIGTGITQINFVGTGYTVTASGNVASISNLGMGFTSLSITSAGTASSINAGSQISYTATASDANANFFVESAPAGIGQIGINYTSGVMGGGQNASAGTYNVKLRAATLFGLSEPFNVSFTINPFSLNMNTIFGDPTTFVMMTDASGDQTFTSLASGGVVSYDGSAYVIDRSNTNYSTATKHALYYDNTNNELYGFRTNSGNSAIAGIYKWTSVSSASHGTSVGSGSVQQSSTWATDYAVSEVSALHGTKTYNTLTLDAGIDDFDGAYTRQSFKAKLDTGTVSSGNALFAADSGYWWFLKDSDNSRMIIYSSSDSAWTYVYVSGGDFSSATNNTAVGSANAVESQTITDAIYDDNAVQPESEYSEITYPGAVGTAAFQPGGNYTHSIGGAFAMKITTTGNIMDNFGTNDTDWAYGFTLEDPWVVTAAGNQLLAPESNSDGWHNFGLALFNISTTEYDYITYGANGYGPYSTSIFSGSFGRATNTNNFANAGDTIQIRFDGASNGYYYVYVNGVLKVTTSSPDSYMSATNTTNPVLTFGDTTNQNGGTIVNDYGVGQPWPFRIRDLWVANNGNISASDVAAAATFTSRNLASWDQYGDVDVYITLDDSGITAVKGSPTVERKSITFS